MTATSKLNISWKAYLVYQVLTGVLTIVIIMKPLDMFVKGPFEAYTGASWSELMEEHPKQAALYTLFCQAGAAGMFSLILLGMFINLSAYRKGEMWAWIALLTGLIVVNAIQMPQIFSMAGSRGLLVRSCLACPGLIILLLPVKEMLANKTPIANQSE